MFFKRPLTSDDIEQGRQATTMLNHRGPDYQGEYIDKKNGVYIGHTRLSIIDLTENSNQPLIDEKYVLAFNGEIYDYKAHRNNLKKLGLNFYSEGDAEVLLRAWQMWGARMP